MQSFVFFKKNHVIRICYSNPVDFTNLLNYIFSTFLGNAASSSSG